MEKEMASFKIDNQIIKKILEKQISAAIVQNLGDSEKLLAKMISLALHQKVNADGYYDKASYRNEYDFLEVTTNKAVQKAAKDALSEWLEKNTKKVKIALMNELAKPSRQKTMAKAFADAVERSITSNWHMNCTVNFDRDRG